MHSSISALNHRRDRRLIYGAALLRGLAAGAISVLAAVYLAKRGFPADDIGVVLSAGMAGVFAGTAYGTFLADRVGRRRSLVGLALLAAVGGAALAWFDSLWAIALAAFIGMLSTQGSDRGAAQALEVSILPSTTSDAERTRVYAWYNALADAGGAAGALLAALPAVLRMRFELTEVRAYDATIFVYAALLVGVALLYTRLSRATEPAQAGTAGPGASGLPPSARRNVWRFAGLSAMDSLGGGFIGSALIAYYLYARFGIGEGALALLFRRGTRDDGAVALRRRLAGAAHRARQHDGVHAHPVEPAAADAADRAELRRRGGALHPARRAVGDGRTDAPVVPDGDRAAP